MVSLISIISTSGIALGVMVLIVGLSAMNGFERELNNRILSVVPHGEIEPLRQPLFNWKPAIERVNQTPGVHATAPYIDFTGLIESGDKMQALQIRGVDPQMESYVSSLPRFVARLAWQNFTANEKQVILGGGIADSLKVREGDWVTVMIPNNDAKNKLLQPKRIRLHVTGILELSGSLDHSLALVPLNDAQKYLDMGTGISGIAVSMDNPFKAQTLVREAGERSGVAAHIKTWITSYGYMYRDIQMIRAIMYLAMVLVITVASFNIVSTLVMAVKDKSGDIAVLRTLGAGDRLIRAIFIWYGISASLVGSTIGMISGVLVSLNLTSIMEGVEHITGHKLLSGDIYFINFLPSELHWLDVIYVMITAIILSLLASWYPARRASQINPARVLSGQ